MARTFTRQGLGYVMHVPEIAGEFAVSRIRTKSGDTHGEVVVSCGLVGTKSSDGVLHQANLNLGSTTSRKTLAATLRERSNAPEIDWPDLLEDFCRRVLAAERKGAPVVTVGNRPQLLLAPWRLEPILAEGKPTIIYGKGGDGKSTLATLIAVSVVTGATLVDGWRPRRAPVLYLDWEAEDVDLDLRVKAIAAGANIPYPVEVAYRRCYRPLADEAEEISRVVAEGGYGLAIVDSLALAAGTSNEGSDAAEAAIRLFAAFRLLGTTVLALGHVSKADLSEPGKAATPYGSVFYTNLARSTFELRRSPGSDGTARLGLYNTKTNVSRPLPPVGLEEVRDEEAGTIAFRRFEVVDDPTLAQRVSLSDRILAALVDGDLKDLEIAELVGASEKVVNATLNRMVRDRMKAGRPPLVERLPSSGKWHRIPWKEAAS